MKIFVLVAIAKVRNSTMAIQASNQFDRAFIRLREMLASHQEFATKLGRLEKRYDAQFKVVFDAVRQLMAPPESPKQGRIGFSETEKLSK